MNTESILKKIKPSKKEMEKNLATARLIIEYIRGKFGLDAVLVGSVARGTALKGKSDLDIFIMFPKSTKRETLEKTGIKVGKSVAKFLGCKSELHYAQHPYVRIICRDRRIEIVPAYRIKPGDRIISAVDRTPLHNEYVKKNLRNKDDVLLLKWFMKQIGVYGAEIKTRGFSGYLCELLVIKYGSFKRVLEEASVWEPPVVIDVEGQYDDVGEILEKFNDPLVVIDPVDKDRNVASPVSLEKMARFSLASRMFIKTGRLPKLAKRQTKDKKVITVIWKIKPANEEVVWSQLESFGKRVKERLENCGFRVKDIIWWTDSERTAELLIDLDTWELSQIEIRQGPSAFDFNNSEKFIEKYAKVKVGEDGRVYSERKRARYKAEDAIKHILKESPKYLGRNWRIYKKPTGRVKEIYEHSFWSW